MFKKIYNWRYYKKGKQEKQNSEKFRPVRTFKVDRNNLEIVDRMKERKQLTKFINEAIDLKQMFEMNPELFLRKHISEYYSLSKHILRKEGRKLKKEETNCLK